MSISIVMNLLCCLKPLLAGAVDAKKLQMLFYRKIMFLNLPSFLTTFLPSDEIRLSYHYNVVILDNSLGIFFLNQCSQRKFFKENVAHDVSISI